MQILLPGAKSHAEELACVLCDPRHPPDTAAAYMPLPGEETQARQGRVSGPVRGQSAFLLFACLFVFNCGKIHIT